MYILQYIVPTATFLEPLKFGFLALENGTSQVLNFEFGSYSVTFGVVCNLQRGIKYMRLIFSFFFPSYYLSLNCINYTKYRTLEDSNP